MAADKIKEIEQKYDMWAEDYNLTPQDVEWLIKQAERVRELEVWYHSYHKEAKLNNILKIQNKRYREAIEKAINILKHVPSEKTPKKDAISTLQEALKGE